MLVVRPPALLCSVVLYVVLFLFCSAELLWHIIYFCCTEFCTYSTTFLFFLAVFHGKKVCRVLANDICRQRLYNSFVQPTHQACDFSPFQWPTLVSVWFLSFTFPRFLIFRLPPSTCYSTASTARPIIFEAASDFGLVFVVSCEYLHTVHVYLLSRVHICMLFMLCTSRFVFQRFMGRSPDEPRCIWFVAHQYSNDVDKDCTILSSN